MSERALDGWTEPDDDVNALDSDLHATADGAPPPRPAYTEALLDAVTRAPLRRDPEAVAKHFVSALSAQLSGCAVGVCVVSPLDQRAIVEMRLPHGAGEAGRDPTRLFPRFDHERILPVPSLAGSTLHVARDGEPFDPCSPEFELATRTAAVLGVLLPCAFELRRPMHADLDAAELRTQLAQAEKLAAFGQVAAGVIHELANPLTSIVAYADYLAKKSRTNGGDEGDVQRLERIGEAAERILKFSRDLIAYARPAVDPPGPVNVQEVIDQAILFCEHEFSRRKIELVRSFATHLAPVRGLSPQLTQVFVNLFTNAAHAMSEHGGTLLVEATLEADEIGVATVRVTDTGTGIPKENLERIFDPFFTTKSKLEGTGLGLYIVRDILQKHGGTLEAASTWGEGTTFTVRLPLFAPRTLAPEPPAR